MSSFNPVHVSHRFVEALVSEGNCCVDATVGNGYDTVFLAKRVGVTGHVLGVDIQAEAVTQAKDRLAASALGDRVCLRVSGHEDLDEHIRALSWRSIKLAMFNLGYLPGSDKSIVTLPANTIRALAICERFLDTSGAISLIAYRGHEGGMEEYEAVSDWFEKLSKDEFLVLRYERWTRSGGVTPVFFWAQKRS